MVSCSIMFRVPCALGWGGLLMFKIVIVKNLSLLVDQVIEAPWRNWQNAAGLNSAVP